MTPFMTSSVECVAVDDPSLDRVIIRIDAGHSTILLRVWCQRCAISGTYSTSKAKP
jgi:hypothetical protein